MSALTCIVHYAVNNSKILLTRNITNINFQRIKQAKSIRIERRGRNFHEEQCKLIPNEIDPEKHGIHLECYKRFTLIISSEKNKISPKLASIPSSKTSISPKKCLKRKRLQTTQKQKDLYPKECSLCHKYTIRDKHKKKVLVKPSICLTKEAEAKIKHAAKVKKLDLYFEIKDVDLIAKEFKYHKNCYRNLTRQTTEVDTVDRFEAVAEYVHENIIINNEFISMDLLNEKFGGPQDRYARRRLKKMLKEKFISKLTFITLGRNEIETVVSSDISNLKVLLDNPKIIIKKAAEFLRIAILDHAKTMPELSWPIHIEDILSEERDPPELLKSFFHNILNDNHYDRAKVIRLVQSLSSDLIFNVTNGKVIPPKHYLLALGLHSLTGQKTPLKILNRFGNCLEYNLTCEIETSHAEAALLNSQNSNALIFKPIDNTCSVTTFFWADNFDMNVETPTGHGGIHSTHMIVFQEESDVSKSSQDRVTFERTKKRTITDVTKLRTDILINSKVEPPKLSNYDKTTEN